MAKPLRYGPTIGVRLPLEIHETVLERAGERGPGPWIRDLVETALGASRGYQPGTFQRIDGDTVSNHAEICDHAKNRVRSSGVRVCASCGATKTGNGPWVTP